MIDCIQRTIVLYLSGLKTQQEIIWEMLNTIPISQGNDAGCLAAGKTGKIGN